MAKYILFDTETTGNKEEDRIIQVGSMIVDSSGKVDLFDELCSTVLPIKIEAMAVHGITPDKIENRPSFINTDFYKELLILNNQDNFLIAHNMPFDLGMLEKEGFKSNLKIIDTLRVAKHLIKDTKSHSLQYLRYYLELYKKEQEEANKYNIIIKPHDAIGDVLVMKLLLSYLVTLIKKDFPSVNPMIKMVELTQTPIFVEVFKFGKYKDKKIEDVCDEDIGYIDWMMDNMDLDEDLKYTLDKIMGHV
jgi:DNA polymerase III epsilon subunit-like protein